MAEHESRGRKAARPGKARLRRRQAAVIVQPGVRGTELGQAVNSLPRGEREAFVTLPDLPTAQRALAARSLQQSQGNRYVQRLLIGGKDVTIVPRANLTGIIARWPPDSDEEKRRLLTQGSSNLFTLIEAPISFALDRLNEEDPPFWATYGMLEDILGTVDSLDFDLPEFSVVVIGQSLAYIQQAVSALEAMDGEGRNIRQLVHLAWVRARMRRFSPSWIPRGRWQRGVVAPLDRARRLTSGRRPNFTQALRFVNRAVVNLNRMTGRNADEGDVLRGHQSRIGDAEAALRVLTTERGNSRRFIRGLLASADLSLSMARDEIDEELGALGEGESAPEAAATGEESGVHGATHMEGLHEEYAEASQ